MSEKKHTRVTLKDVAKHAGVSRSTASLVLQKSPLVSKKTREKVLASMSELGYVYDRVAASLRSQRSSTIGVIITDIANMFFSDFLIGVHQTLEKEGYTVLLGTTYDDDRKQARLLSTMLENRVGGIILCPTSDCSEATMEKISQMDIPIITAVKELPKVSCDFVGVDNKLGIQLAVKHLLDKGHRRIAFLGGRSGSSIWQERMDGYTEAMQEAQIDIDDSLIVESQISRDGGLKAVKKVLQLEIPPTAIICFNDIVAFGVMRGLKTANLIPGHHIDVIGFDNVAEGEIVSPPLTTVSGFTQDIGVTAANLLEMRLNNEEMPQQRIVLKPKLVIRET